MAITLATGAVLAIAKTYGSSVSMTALTNAAEAIATLAPGHGVVAGDYLEVTSGWGLIDKRIVRALSVSTNDVTFEDINTSNTTNYPAAGGTGSIRRITAWENLTQVKSISVSGGDQQFADITAIDDQVQRQIPTIRGAVAVTVDTYDDPSLAWYDEVSTASDSKTPYGFRIVFPNGSRLVANSYWSLQKTPAITVNEALMTQISLTYAAEPVRYAS